jgi:hypothetical protein
MLANRAALTYLLTYLPTDRSATRLRFRSVVPPSRSAPVLLWSARFMAEYWKL